MICEFYVGSYGKETEEGITRYQIDTENGRLTRLDGHALLYHPSYLCLQEEKGLLYAVQEQVPEGKIHALKIIGKELVPCVSLSSGGADPCHLSLSEDGNMLYAANYTSGSLAAYRLSQDGLPVSMTDFKQHDGKGPNPVRQECAHVHFSTEHEGILYVCDLGLDKVFLYELDTETGMLNDTGKRLSLPLGNGPRHLAFHPAHPDMVYVLCELAGQVAVFRDNDGNRDYRLVQLLDTLPEGFSGGNISAAVKISGNLLFASNRGHDSIAVFNLKENGTLERMGIYLSGGKTPRDIEIFGDYLVAANQDSDCLTVLKIDRETGELSLTGERKSHVMPCCVCAYGQNP
ncbi:lactonase family protein [Fusibacillus kribbianus]|uniref:Lactonase family protein n=1 Tax=Fusibacillus kribbianus TaxID=3044208 RepID=A0AAP4BB91_9FIRM|nr:lactonase family protein [Ruminococcus sp. YH-rum2234]MDI9241728.1 lactonase family protein [Ruminococcus sp. YH-rum2234]